MSWPLLVVLAVGTVASRVLPMALLGEPRGRVAAVLDALPAPLFAALAGLALLDGGSRPPLAVVLAATAALVGAVRRSLALTLLLGLAGFAVGTSLGS